MITIDTVRLDSCHRSSDGYFSPVFVFGVVVAGVMRCIDVKERSVSQGPKMNSSRTNLLLYADGLKIHKEGSEVIVTYADGRIKRTSDGNNHLIFRCQMGDVEIAPDVTIDRVDYLAVFPHTNLAAQFPQLRFLNIDAHDIQLGVSDTLTIADLPQLEHLRIDGLQVSELRLERLPNLKTVSLLLPARKVVVQNCAIRRLHFVGLQPCWPGPDPLVSSMDCLVVDSNIRLLFSSWFTACHVQKIGQSVIHEMYHAPKSADTYSHPESGKIFDSLIQCHQPGMKIYREGSEVVVVYADGYSDRTVADKIDLLFLGESGDFAVAKNTPVHRVDYVCALPPVNLPVLFPQLQILGIDFHDMPIRSDVSLVIADLPELELLQIHGTNVAELRLERLPALESVIISSSVKKVVVTQCAIQRLEFVGLGPAWTEAEPRIRIELVDSTVQVLPYAWEAYGAIQPSGTSVIGQYYIA